VSETLANGAEDGQPELPFDADSQPAAAQLGELPGETFEDIFAGEAHARSGDPWTSHEAARSLDPAKLRRSQEAVLACFKLHGPMHQADLVTRYGLDMNAAGWPWQSPSGLRTRCSELVTGGLLEDSGEYAVLPSRRKAIVWQVSERGR
jgi:hypothetical protein